MKRKTNSVCLQPEQLSAIFYKLSFLVKNYQKGDQFFLSPNEVDLLYKFSTIGNEKSIANGVGISVHEIHKRVRYIVLKLQFNHQQFKSWEQNQIPFIMPYHHLLPSINF